MTSYRDWGMYILLCVHLAVTATYITKFLMESPEWHWAWGGTELTENSDPLQATRLAARYAMFSRIVPDLLRQQACPLVLSKAEPDKFGSLPEPYATTQMAMCRFGRVSEVRDQAGSPYSMSVMKTATPLFLLATVQVAIFSHLFWTTGPIKMMAARSGWVRVLWPWDLMVAWLILVIWVALTLLVHKERRVVYNNVVLAVAVAVLTALLQLFWSWRSAGAGSSTAPDSIVTDPEDSLAKARAQANVAG
eukprot:3136186-Rhodomonas_salina.3